MGNVAANEWQCCALIHFTLPLGKLDFKYKSLEVLSDLVIYLNPGPGLFLSFGRKFVFIDKNRSKTSRFSCATLIHGLCNFFGIRYFCIFHNIFFTVVYSYLGVWDVLTHIHMILPEKCFELVLFGQLQFILCVYFSVILLLMHTLNQLPVHKAIGLHIWSQIQENFVAAYSDVNKKFNF